MDIQKTIRIIPDFPKKGIMFQDITTLLTNAEAFRETIDLFYQHFRSLNIDYIAAVESRGYLFGAPLAYKLGCGLVIIRKAGKLPAEVERVQYDLEYGTDILEVHKGAIEQGKRVVVIDDILATGGTIKAACQLIEKIGGKPVSAAFVIELDGLHGRDKIPLGTEVFALFQAKE